jgi:16S rRNA processing protein RimM
MSDDPASLIELGVVGAPFGVRGWVKLRSFTDPPDRLLQHRTLQLSVGLGGAWAAYTLEATGRSAGQLTAKFAGVNDRDQAQGLRGSKVCVPRSELPQRNDKDFYRADLIGCAVQNLAGVRLGKVQHFVETPGQVLMVVRGDEEYWVPAVPRHLRRVDLAARLVVVDWDAGARLGTDVAAGRDGANGVTGVDAP